MMTDLEIENHGSVTLVRPLTDAGRQWMEASLDAQAWQWFGGALASEPRYVPGLVELAIEDGLTVG